MSLHSLQINFISFKASVYCFQSKLAHSSVILPCAMSMVDFFVQLLLIASTRHWRYHLERQDPWPLLSTQPV